MDSALITYHNCCAIKPNQTKTDGVLSIGQIERNCILMLN